MWLMKTLLTSRCINQRGAGQDEYVKRFHECDAYDRMFFVWHSGPLNEDQQIDGVTLIGPEKLSEIILESGLTRWLRKKVW